MNKLIILDYHSGDVDIYPIKSGHDSNIDELIESLWHSINNCHWMVSKGNITFHKEVLK